MGTRSTGLGALFIGLVLFCQPCVGEDAPQPPVVKIDSGRISGVLLEDGMVAFRGIPFAAPPVGALRWRPPQPAEPWRGVRDASAFGPACMQFELVRNRTPTGMSEDCLTVNVWTSEKALEAGTKRPVLVWIHGGGFRLGTGASPSFDSNQLVHDGVILVTFNYRLGRLGFFAHPALAAEHPDEPRGNYWFMDQVAALEWVHRNIGAFGGDPAKVTITGASAGGASVNTHMISPASKGLFRAASSISGGGDIMYCRLTEPWITGPSLEAKSAAWAEGAGLGGAGATPDVLRAVSAEVVIDQSFDAGSGDFIAVDGDLVPDIPTVIFGEGRRNDVPYIAGGTSYEGSNHLGAGGDPVQIYQMLQGGRPEVHEAYGLAEDEVDPYELGLELYGDAFFVAPPRMLAAAAARTGSSPTYLYHYAYPFSNQPAEWRGAPHAINSSFVLGGFENLTRLGAVEITDRDQKAMALVYDYWLRFVETGDPNGDGLPEWPAYDPETDVTLVFDDRGATAVAGFRAKVLDFYNAEYERGFRLIGLETTSE
jgi:para-nitrobenzyl esterase